MGWVILSRGTTERNEHSLDVVNEAGDSSRLMLDRRCKLAVPKDQRRMTCNKPPDPHFLCSERTRGRIRREKRPERLVPSHHRHRKSARIVSWAAVPAERANRPALPASAYGCAAEGECPVGSRPFKDGAKGTLLPCPDGCVDSALSRQTVPLHEGTPRRFRQTRRAATKLFDLDFLGRRLDEQGGQILQDRRWNRETFAAPDRERGPLRPSRPTDSPSEPRKPLPPSHRCTSSSARPAPVAGSEYSFALISTQ